MLVFYHGLFSLFFPLALSLGDHIHVFALEWSPIIHHQHPAPSGISVSNKLLDHSTLYILLSPQIQHPLCPNLNYLSTCSKPLLSVFPYPASRNHNIILNTLFPPALHSFTEFYRFCLRNSSYTWPLHSVPTASASVQPLHLLTTATAPSVPGMASQLSSHQMRCAAWAAKGEKPIRPGNPSRWEREKEQRFLGGLGPWRILRLEWKRRLWNLSKSCLYQWPS